MTDAEAKDVAEELAALSLDQRRRYLADLAKTDEAAAGMVKDELKRLWAERNG